MRSPVRLMRVVLGLALIVLVVVAFVYIRGRLSSSRSNNTPAVISLSDIYLEGYIRLNQEKLDEPARADASEVLFTVKPGQSAADIAEELQKQGLVSSSELFTNYAKYKDLGGSLEAGDYALRGNMTIPEIVERLAGGKVRTATVTLTEGWRREQMADLLGERRVVNPAEFLRVSTVAGHDFEFLRGLAPDATLEGYLFPDTYRVPPQMGAADMVDLMLRTFDKRFTPDLRQKAAQRGLTIHQVVTLASIVEREAAVAEERPMIAGVYLNRMKIGMKLDADPTVQYALGFQTDSKVWWKKGLLVDDLKFASPYNTYVNNGLPPGPICNPGLASLKAVLEPKESNALYFVAKGDGSHVFAATFAEHQANAAKYQN